jgi:nucleoside-diphosphate-sugar epimerase
LTVYGDGSQTRSFCYVSDLIAGIARLLEAAPNPGAAEKSDTAADDDIHNPVNIGNPNEFTVCELAGKVIEFTKSASIIDYKPLPEDDPRVRRPDIQRAQRLLDWQPRVNLDEGLRMTIEYFKGVV